MNPAGKVLVCTLQNLQPLGERNGVLQLQTAEAVVYPPGADKAYSLGNLVVGDHYAEGMLGLFFPPGAILTDGLLQEMWLFNYELGKGRLAGKKGNRVKVKEVGGAPSCGLFYGSKWRPEPSSDWMRGASWKEEWRIGQDVAQELQVTFADAGNPEPV